VRSEVLNPSHPSGRKGDQRKKMPDKKLATQEKGEHGRECSLRTSRKRGEIPRTWLSGSSRRRVLGSKREPPKDLGLGSVVGPKERGGGLSLGFTSGRGTLGGRFKKKTEVSEDLEASRKKNFSSVGGFRRSCL